MALPIVAIIGRPNVGKSTLFNRIIRKPLAIIDNRPGVTRDRNATEFEWNGRRFLLMDTGGFVIASRDMMEQAVSEQTAVAVEEADLVLFLTDGKTGVTDLDNDIARMLIKSSKPVVLAVSKIDRNRDEPDIYEFYNLGLGEPMPVSGATGRGSGDLLDEIVAGLPDAADLEDDPDSVKVALIGRPNVGKSSIVNSVTGKSTVLVTDVPGTTRDSTDTHVMVGDTRVVLVDTAGLKRTAKLKESLDYFSSVRTIRSLERCDVAIAVVDISEGLTSYDKRLIHDIVEQKKGLIIAANKWDLVTKDHRTHDEMTRDIYDELPDKRPYPIVFTSALTGQRVKRLLDVAVDIAARRTFRVQTAELNRLVENCPIPPGSGDFTMYYATQYGIEPPSFVFFVNEPRNIKDNFHRYLEKHLRAAFGFEGTPVVITFKRRR